MSSLLFLVFLIVVVWVVIWTCIPPMVSGTIDAIYRNKMHEENYSGLRHWIYLMAWSSGSPQ